MFQECRLRALREAPEAFGSTYAEEAGLSMETVAGLLAPPDGPAQVVLGAFVEGDPGGDALVGMIVCHQERRLKARHKAVIGGMYVAPGARGRGIGRALLERAVAEARGWPGVEKVTLTVVERAAAARSLYHAAGFRPYGLEPDSLRQDGVRDTVEYLSLDLRTAPGAGPRVEAP
ncbi:MAG TPA: GNAT family N-acetyltransferase [Longimicrobiaceae bacterium]|nr:GNAT family N-acetyltransferase [Longimicrobiaceae bacterium]